MVRNVVLVTIDSLRFDHLHKPNSEPGITPEDMSLPGLRERHRARLATDDVSLYADSVAFEKAFATGPGTTPSFPGLLTGTLPLSYDGLGPLGSARPRLASALREVGLHTGGFNSNPFLSEHFNYDVGFDEFNDYQNPLMGVATKVFPRGIEINNPKLSWLDEKLHVTNGIKKFYQLIKGKPRPYVDASVITDDTIDWIETTNGSFFAWAHYMDVHHPCYPPEEYRTEFGVPDVDHETVAEWYSSFAKNGEIADDVDVETLYRLYHAAIAYTFDQVTRIVDSLLTMEKYEETLFILTSDHGGLFGDYGRYGKPIRMYDELLQVPLLIANGPDSLVDATETLVSLLDVPPLVHDALGIEIPETYEGATPNAGDRRDYILAEHEVQGNPIVGARSRQWLYEADEIANEHRLFDLSGPEIERHEISDDGSEVRRVVLERLAELDVESRYLNGGIASDIESRLEDLGYLE